MATDDTRHRKSRDRAGRVLGAFNRRLGGIAGFAAHAFDLLAALSNDELTLAL